MGGVKRGTVSRRATAAYRFSVVALPMMMTARSPLPGLLISTADHSPQPSSTPKNVVWRRPCNHGRRDSARISIPCEKPLALQVVGDEVPACRRSGPTGSGLGV